jgi:hypothetical protein
MTPCWCRSPGCCAACRCPLVEQERPSIRVGGSFVCADCGDEELGRDPDVAGSRMGQIIAWREESEAHIPIRGPKIIARPLQRTGAVINSRHGMRGNKEEAIVEPAIRLRLLLRGRTRPVRAAGGSVRRSAAVADALGK